jgi:hypothetical protein
MMCGVGGFNQNHNASQLLIIKEILAERVGFELFQLL